MFDLYTQSLWRYSTCIFLFRVIDNEEKPSKHRKDFDFHLDWTVYWTLEEIYDWMDALQLEFPDIVTNFTVGTSSEGRQIRGIIINTLPPLPGKRSIFFESTIHSNEWISAATTTWIINEFLRSTDSDVREIANRYTLYFVPVVNVDGYKYSWTTDRNWRKTRGATRNILCKGTDPNRNWDLNFSEHGSSNNPCSNNYAGDFAFSEPETKALSEFIQGIYQLIGYFSFHSYSQYLMIPYAYTTEKVENYSDLYEIGKMAIESLNSKHETQYNVGSIESFFGLVSGSSVDWVKKNKDPNIVYCYELRPTQESDYGMLLPADQIIDNSEEIFSSLITIFKESYNKGLL